jgi:hypothetical protein
LGAAAFALFQVLTYYKAYPHGAFPAAMSCVMVLGVGGVIVALLAGRVRDDRSIRRLALGSLLLDGIVVAGLTLSYTWDTNAAVWAVMYILPMDAAARFQMKGALLSGAAIAITLAVREVYAHNAFNYEFTANSVLFRAGIGFIIAAVVGAMAKALNVRVQQLTEYVEQVGRVTDAAAAVEGGTFEPASIDGVAARSDALGGLARVFQRMAREVAARERALRDQVQQMKIEIDQSRAAKSAAEITETDYFQDLQKKVDQLRISSET